MKERICLCHLLMTLFMFLKNHFETKDNQLINETNENKFYVEIIHCILNEIIPSN